MKRKISSLGNGNGDIGTNAAAISRSHFIRSFQHVDGNWPSHVHLIGDYKSIKDIIHLCMAHLRTAGDDDVSPSSTISIGPPRSGNRGQQHLRDSISSSSSISSISSSKDMLGIDMDAIHLSLSRPFVLRVHQIEPFVRELSMALGLIHQFSVEVSSSYRLLLNDQKTRLFASLAVKEDARRTLHRIVAQVDRCLQLFNQQPYYQHPLFHISFASMPIREQHAIISSSSSSSPSDDDAVSSEVIVVSRARAAGFVGLDALSTEEEDDDDDHDDDDWRACLLSTSNKQRVSRGSTSTSTSSGSGGGGGAVSALSSLLSSYGSDDDEEEEEEVIDTSNHDDDKEGEDQDEGDEDESVVVGDSRWDDDDDGDVPALGRVLAFHAVECTIGNRSFRLHLMSSPSTSTCCSTTTITTSTTTTTNMNMSRGRKTTPVHSNVSATTTKYPGLFYEEIK